MHKSKMYKRILVALATILMAAILCAQLAAAANPKPLGYYVAKWATLQAGTKSDRNVNQFFGYCTASKHSKYSFSALFIALKSSGKFSYSHQTSINTPDGGTLASTSKVTIEGKFVSKKEADGTYRLHKPGCKKIKFKAKLQKGG